MGKKKNWSLSIIIVMLLSLFLLAAGCAGGDQARVRELEQEAVTLRSEKGTLQDRVTVLEAELDALRLGEEIRKVPKEGWQQYFPSAEETTLTGESTVRVRELLGEPPVLIRSIAVDPEFSREIWIFSPFEEDPTGLYLFFKGGQLDSSILTEFNGLYMSDLLDLEQFWIQ